ncbi:MAG TPA: ubiquinol-cytochrome c reductase iron-sulfur subunit [Bryobacteraceae bacterium]|nr:ubiquinol-cytochrome c reductase iron-sulfur subunit [Bryobacteraceae bacterium]
MHRRSFGLGLLAGMWSLIGAALALPAAAYLFSGPRSRKGTGWVDAADLSKLPVGVPEEVVFRRNRVDGWKVVTEKNTAWVLKKSEKEVIAFAPQCTHLGCAYHWVEQTKEFLCPCHTSTFSPDGQVLTGPAPRALDRYDIRVKGGRLMIGDVQKTV